MKTNFQKKFFSAAILMLVAAGLNLSAKAQGYINGDISFDGGATLDAPLGSATKFMSIFGPGGLGLPQSLTTSGDYTPVLLGTSANFSLFTFSPPPGASFPLWALSSGGVNYSFQATSITFVFQNSMFLDISGTGIASITGFLDTPGTWSIVDTGQSASPVFTFGAATQVTGPPVPEPSTFALLASLLPVVGAFAFRSKAKS